MSYDLVAFDPRTAPSTRIGFVEWFRVELETMGRTEPQSDGLREWMLNIEKSFPALSAASEADFQSDAEAFLTDYSVGGGLVYACFAWSKAEEALRRSSELALEHGVGLYEVSSDVSQIWWPDGGRWVLL